MWKDFFYFSKNERRGIIILILLIILVKGIEYGYKCTEKGSEISISETVLQDYEVFLASLQEKESKRTYRQKDSKESLSFEKTLYEFDPNTLDSVGFLRLGLSSFSTSNILKYRRKQGHFKHPQDLARIYGISPETFAELSPWIHIKELLKEDIVTNNQFTSNKEKINEQKETLIEESKETIRPFKYAKGTIVDLNEADTTELKKVPGIGSGIAKSIVAYRYKLGGFTRLDQLQDISYIPDTLNQWFFIPEDFEARRIDLNKASMERLTSHPYLNFYQAKVIIEYRKKNGKLKNLKQLALYEEFSAEDMDRLYPYVSF